MTIGRPVLRFQSVASTQDIVFRLAELGAAHGTTVRAEYQTAGRGRQGRRWDSPPSTSLMFSVLLRPTCGLHELGTFSLLIGNALADVFARYTQRPVALKWPNDVLIDGQKCSGVLIQTRTSPEPVAVVGIGINVSTSLDHLPAGATSLNVASGKPVDRESLFRACTDALERSWNQVGLELPRDVHRAIENRLWLKGQIVAVRDAGAEYRGQLIGIDPAGGLTLSIDGESKTIVSGELTRGPRVIGAEN